MISYLLSILFCIALYELLVLVRTGQDAMSIVRLTWESLQLLRSSELSDADKQQIMVSRSVQTLKTTLRITTKILAICATMYLAFLLVTAPLPYLRKAMAEVLMTPLAITTFAVVTVCYAWLRRALRTNPP